MKLLRKSSTVPAAGHDTNSSTSVHIHSRMMHQRIHVSETLWKFDLQIILENSFVLVFVLAPQP